VHIRFLLLQKEKEADEGDFTLTLNRKMTYEQFSAKVGEHLKVDPSHLRFSTMYQNLKQKTNVKRNLNQSLYQILNPNTSGYAYNTNQRNDSLYYEVLEQSLSEYETKKLLKVTWLSEGIAKEVCIEKRTRYFAN
jgi:ubiquitin carboxyl-terminal hydrolase 7